MTGSTVLGRGFWGVSGESDSWNFLRVGMTMREPFSFDGFLSHSSKDKAEVRELAERLKGGGVAG